LARSRQINFAIHRLRGLRDWQYRVSSKYTHPLQVGADVEALQKAISRVGIPVTIDRTFGPGLEKAVKQFQAKRNLGADGIVGGRTLRALGLSDIGLIDVFDRELIAAV
jgi:murein L,D-transpeptidase YcbB/YkuD